MSALVIEGLLAREIIDSRGNPTVEVDVITKNGVFRCPAPSGASTGKHEALELRDGDVKRFHGKGVLNAVNIVNTQLNEALKGMDVTKQEEIDRKMIALDGTENKCKIGANAMTAVSLAVSRAGAHAKGLPLFQYVGELAGVDRLQLPLPSFNVINGGVHAGNNLAFQEFMIIPVGASNFREALRMGCEVYHCLKQVITMKFGAQACGVGDEGGFAPPIDRAEKALDLIMEAIQMAGYTTEQIKIGIDAAASEFFMQTPQQYDLGFKHRAGDKGSVTGKRQDDDEEILSGERLLSYYVNLSTQYPIIFIEDPFDQEDWTNFAQINTSYFPSHVMIIGDDLLVTNTKRIQMACDKNACNALLLKVNQVGTLTEALEAMKLARSDGWKVIVSHRSGDTADSYTAELAVGIGADFLKSGAPCRSERLAKYNQVLRIEEALDKSVCRCGSIACNCGSTCSCEIQDPEFANFGKKYIMRCG